MKSVALLAAVWIGLTALCVWLVANNKIQAWDLYAILFALVRKHSPRTADSVKHNS
jgi:hypothetical protein